MPAVPSKIAFLGMDPILSDELSLALALLNVEVVPVSDPEVQLAFCDSALISRLIQDLPQVPVVVVSSQRHVNDWLDAMDAGAVDYCSSPFESADLDWILQSNLRPMVKKAA